MSTNHFPTRLAAELDAQGLSQYEFAQRLNVSESQVSKWATGRRTPIRAHRALIAKKLKVNEEALWPS